ncbi:LysR substrate binding domain-containing protein [Paracoccus aminovorans]|uniref:LysR substrate binding domain-containing protein n=1 Tax=Paracoccus aminovorans TaxID=34004 RepID=A0A1I3DT83_9RHOB|nr:LysR substrate-binding domain-containing protein [Paracoccus aminovorans]CQR86942.1 hypothetical protein JCM7685_2390 [Paracoccus aminovorans]SFH89936.1 LysR substrate binding domain-containing protein [Paracoccus aminovorans]
MPELSVVKADLASFQVLGDAYARDAKGLIMEGVRKRGIDDPTAVEALGHPLATQPAITWADLAGETFLVRQGGTRRHVHDHIVLRLAGRWPAPSIMRLDVGRGTMVGQGFGITIVGAATSMLPTTGIVFLPFIDEPEPIPFSAVWSPCNRNATLRNMLALAAKMGRLRCERLL